MFLYVITNLANGKQYVGVTDDVKRRKREHRSGNGSKLVSAAIRKYGGENLEMEVWYEGDDEWIRLMEFRTVLALGTLTPTGYNIVRGGTLCPSELHKKPVVLNGINFGSIGEAVEYFHTSYKTIRKHVDRGDIEFVRGESKRCVRYCYAKPVLVNGVRFDSLKSAAEDQGINYNTLRRRFLNYEQTGHWPVGFATLTNSEKSNGSY